MKTFLVTLAGIVAFIYLLNPTFGIFELLPDNIPLIGNVDDATATTVHTVVAERTEEDRGCSGIVHVADQRDVVGQ